MIFESSSVGDTSCDCLALLAALDSQGFQGQLQGAVTAQQQRAHTLGLQQETHSQVPQVFAGSDRRACHARVGAGLIFSLHFQVMSGAAAAAAAVPSYSAMGCSQSWDRKAFRSGTLANTSS
jgi:hypothetical protein